MKRPSAEHLSLAVAALLAEDPRFALDGQRDPLGVDLVVAVPMHWRRRVVRGCNSAELISERLARSLRVPLARRLLKRRRNTLPQADLTPTQRRRNVRGAFAHRTGYDIKGAHVLLADDILTTGATCSEAAKVLKTAGAARVTVAVAARGEGMPSS